MIKINVVSLQYKNNNTFKCNKITYNVNYSYKIKKVANGLIYFDNASALPVDTVRKNFIYNNCQTCHSLQGSSIHEKITIFDWNFEPCVTRKWLWVAITRATYLDNVAFYEYTKAILDNYIDMKIKHYKEQDKKAGRDISYSYVNKAWFMNNFKSNCVSCGCSLGYEIENGKVITSLTANRKHNDDGHNDINDIKENINKHNINKHNMT